MLVVYIPKFSPTLSLTPTNDLTLISQPTPVSTDSFIPTIIFTPSSTPIEDITPTATPLSTEITDAKGVKMALVPAGEFTMGRYWGFVDFDMTPDHKVTIPSYYIDKYEVTNALYKSCVEAGVCTSPTSSGSFTHSSYYGDIRYDNYPVVYVNWNMANKYCEWRSTRLPTEAEWEKAARGTDARTYPWGEALECSYANYRGQYSGCNKDLVAIGQYETGKSPYGIYDMVGMLGNG